MYLQYRDLTIRNATPADVPLLVKWWNDGAVMAHAGFPNGLHTTVEAATEQLLQDSDETVRRLMIEHNGIPIGEMCYGSCGKKEAAIGIKICEPAKQEKGLGRILLSMLIQSLFTEYGYEKIVLDTNLKNARAQHVYELLGFQKLRVNIDSWRDQTGVLQSSVDYELIKENFINFAQ